MRTLCCSDACDKRIECGRHMMNNMGTHYVENFYSFGSARYTDGSCEIEYWCGELGDYKMFETIVEADNED